MNTCLICLQFLHISVFQISEKSIATLRDIVTRENSLTSSVSWKIEEAKVFWFQGEQETAMRQLKQINFVLKVRFHIDFTNTVWVKVYHYKQTMSYFILHLTSF